MTGYAYMTASQKRGTIYIGVTNDLGRRMPEHKSGDGSRFTSRYGVQRLVWYEEHFDIRDAIQREKSLKRWPRQWKIELIEKTNPEWFGDSPLTGIFDVRCRSAICQNHCAEELVICRGDLGDGAR
nr:GIY-YIG nuclease family protein [Mesorhizobium sp.]